MPKKKRTLEVLNRTDQVTGSEVGQLANIPYATVKHYAHEGLLPFTQARPGATRYFKREATMARLKEIWEAQEKGQSVKAIAAVMGQRVTFSLTPEDAQRLKVALKVARKAAPRREDFKILENRLFAGLM